MPGNTSLSTLRRLVRVQMNDTNPSLRAISRRRLDMTLARHLIRHNLLAAPPEEKVLGFVTLVAGQYAYEDLPVTDTIRDVYRLVHRATGRVISRQNPSYIFAQLSRLDPTPPSPGTPTAFALSETWDTTPNPDRVQVNALVWPPPASQWAGACDAYRTSIYDNLTDTSVQPIERTLAHAIVAGVVSELVTSLTSEELNRLGLSAKVAPVLAADSAVIAGLDDERRQSMKGPIAPARKRRW